MKAIFFTCLILASTPRASAWGNEGHEIVALIALHDLKPAAKARILQMFRTEDPSSGLTLPELLMKAATWPDDLRSHPETPVAVFRNLHVTNAAQAKPLHFVNLHSPRFDSLTDCPDSQCAVSAIQRCAEVLDDAQQLTRDRLEALKFLIHFVGDIHQPLHAGRSDDRGGNEIKIAAFLNLNLEAGFNLHEVWDKLVIQHAEWNSTRYARSLTAGITAEMRTAFLTEMKAEIWAEGSYQLAMSAAYVSAEGKPLKDGASLDVAYFNRAKPIVETQLQKAGVRLAAMINRSIAP